VSVRVDGQLVWIEGEGRLDDAETLCAALIGHSGRQVDLSRALSLHTSVVQALLALQPLIRGAPADAFLREWVIPKLTLP
jgi:hypothetical protein